MPTTLKAKAASKIAVNARAVLFLRKVKLFNGINEIIETELEITMIRLWKSGRAQKGKQFAFPEVRLWSATSFLSTTPSRNAKNSKTGLAAQVGAVKTRRPPGFQHAPRLFQGLWAFLQMLNHRQHRHAVKSSVGERQRLAVKVPRWTEMPPSSNGSAFLSMPTAVLTRLFKDLTNFPPLPQPRSKTAESFLTSRRTFPALKNREKRLAKRFFHEIQNNTEPQSVQSKDVGHP